MAKVYIPSLRHSAVFVPLALLLFLVCCARTNIGNSSNSSLAQTNTPAEATTQPPRSNSASKATPDTNQPARTPEETVHQFYDWYLGELRAGKEPFKEEEKMKQYVTDDLMSEIRKRADDSRFDPALFLPNSDSGWHNMKVEVGKPKVYKGKQYYDTYVNVTYKGTIGGRDFLDEWTVGLKQTGVGWRIASLSTE